MRIGIDARFAIRKPRRGIGTYSLNLLRSLVDLSNDIDFVLYTDCVDEDGLLPSSPNVEIRRIWPSAYPLWEQIALPLAVQRDRLDILHSLGNTAPLWLPKRTRLILTLHDVMFLQSHELIPTPTTNYQRAGRFYRMLVVPFNARHADSVITISNFSRRDILNLIPNLISEKVFPIYEACDSNFSVTPVLQQKLVDRPYFLCLGAEDPRKNTDRIVRAYLDSLRLHEIKEDLVIVGYSNWKECPVSELVKNAGAEERVHFLPFILLSDLVALYQHASALLYLSLYEGFGIPILEAYSCGCPIIASNTTSIPEIAGDAALYVTPTDTSAIRQAICSLSNNSKVQANLRAKGFERSKEFNWEKTAIATLQVYFNVQARSEEKLS